MRIGYILVNHHEVERIEEYKTKCNADKYYIDTINYVGEPRSEFDKMYYDLQPTDTLVLYDMCHVVYQIDDMIDLLKDLAKYNVTVEFADNGFTFNSDNAHLIIQVLNAGKNLERQFHRLRQREGIAQAASKGIYAGRPKIEIPNFLTTYTKWKTGEFSAITAAKKMKLSRATFYRRLEEFEETYQEMMKDHQDDIIESTPRKRGRRPKSADQE